MLILWLCRIKKLIYILVIRKNIGYWYIMEIIKVLSKKLRIKYLNKLILNFKIWLVIVNKIINIKEQIFMRFAVLQYCWEKQMK